MVTPKSQLLLIFVAAVALLSAAAYSQTGPVVQPAFGAAPEMISADDRMITPAPISGGAYSVAFAPESARENYVRGGFSFSTAFDDNILPSASGRAISDTSYSLWPWITLNQSRSRVRWDLSYTPGFTFYHKTSSRNQSDHNLGADLQYRVSPHVSLTLRNSFVKTSNMFGEFSQTRGQNSGIGADTPVPTLVPPVVGQINNTANAELTYQFGPNRMIGASGTFSELRFSDTAQVNGLYESSGRQGQAFYAHRLSGKHYLGATYQFQQFLTYPENGETQTHTVLLFYSVFVKSNLVLSAFAGPQHSETRGTLVTPTQNWSPATGFGLGWQGNRTSVALRASRRIAEGGGLSSAVRSHSLDAAVRRQLTRKFTGGLYLVYSDNTILDPTVLHKGGHAIEGSATVERSFGEHLDFGIGYARLHQSYANVPTVSINPDRNRVWLSLSYRFQTAMGR